MLVFFRYSCSPLTASAAGESHAFLCEASPDDHYIFVRNCLNGSLQGLMHSEESISFLGFCTNGTSVLLYTYSDCHTVTIYDTERMKKMNEFFLRDTICNIISHPTSEFIVFLGNFGHLLMYNASTCSVRSLQPTLPQLHMAKLIVDTNMLLYVSQKTKMYVIDICEGTVVHERCLSSQKPAAITYCPSRQQFIHAKGKAIFKVKLETTVE